MILSSSFSPNRDFVKRAWASAEFDAILSEIRVALIFVMFGCDC